MIHDLGPRTRRIFDLLRERILSGQLEPGTRLPPHTRLAADFGVAPMTIRHVLARLEEAGLVSIELGRGTFVRSSALPAVLIVGAPHLREVLGELVRQTGHRVISAGGPEESRAVLGTDRSIGLLLCEISATNHVTDSDFVVSVRRRWPRLAVAIVTSSAASLAALHGTPECPVLLLPTPVRPSQLEEVLRLALRDANRHVSAAEPQLEDLFWRVSEAAIVLNRSTHRIVAWNPASEALLGYPTAEAVGMPFEALVPARVLAELQTQVGPADPILDATEPVELPLVHAGSQEVWVELAVSPLADGFVVLIARDRTAQRTIHDALSFQARLLEAVEQAVVATDPLGRILYWNRGAERMYGWAAEEVLGRNAGEIIVAPELLKRGREIMERLRQGEIWSGEFPVRRRDGTEIPVLVTDSPIRDIDGRLVGVIGVAADLTERKQAEDDRLECARLEALLHATETAQRGLSQQLALNVPYVGQLASDPRLPRHLRPIAGVVLNAVREVVTQLEHPVALRKNA